MKKSRNNTLYASTVAEKYQSYAKSLLTSEKALLCNMISAAM